MEPAPVSVVIPVYNAGDLLIDAIRSVLAQTRKPVEVIVVDDGSSDDPGVKLATLGPRVRLLRQENHGVAEARNLGVAAARGDFIAFLDADDVWHPRKLESQLEAFEAAPTLGLLGTDAFDWPAPSWPTPEASPSAPIHLSRHELIVKNRLVTSSVVVRRAVLDAVGPFDTNLQGTEDHDMWIRISEVAAVAWLDQPLTGYRIIPGSLSQRADSMETGMRNILEKLSNGGTWRGRPLLRRKAESIVDFSLSYIHAVSGERRAALLSLVRSMTRYPFPYSPGEARWFLARPKLLISLALRQSRWTTATRQGASS